MGLVGGPKRALCWASKQAIVGFSAWVTDRTALKRADRLDEVTGAVLFLASDAPSLVTGSALMLAGGWTAA